MNNLQRWLTALCMCGSFADACYADDAWTRREELGNYGSSQTYRPGGSTDLRSLYSGGMQQSPYGGFLWEGPSANAARTGRTTTTTDPRDWTIQFPTRNIGSPTTAESMRSMDWGTTGQRQPAIAPPTYVPDYYPENTFPFRVIPMGIDPADPYSLFFGGGFSLQHAAGLLEITDSDSSWNVLEGALSFQAIVGIQGGADPPSPLYASIDRAFAMSLDGGATYTSIDVDAASGDALYSILSDDAGPDGIHAATEGGVTPPHDSGSTSIGAIGTRDH